MLDHFLLEDCNHVLGLPCRDFMDLDNPLLAWMLDYDAVSTCLRVSIVF